MNPLKTDVPELQANETQVKESTLLRFLLENIPDRIYFKDRQSRFLRISQALARFFTLENAEAAIGRTDFDYFTSEHAQPAFDDEQRMMQTGVPIVGKVEKETLPDGRIGWALTTKMPLRDSEGSIVGTCGISKDFTAQKALEESLEQSNALLATKQLELQEAIDQLRDTHEKLKIAQRQVIEAEKIQSLGRLALGVAHEIRNPLNTLNMAAEFLGGQSCVASDPTMAAIVSSMKMAVTRADSVITELMDASGDAELTLETRDPGPVIRESLEPFIGTFTRTNVQWTVDIPDVCPRIPLDQVRIAETISGIIQNALDAMPSGGHLTLRARALQVTNAELDAGSRAARKLRLGDHILRLEITDTGSGIHKYCIDNIFDPFFTTKATGKGTGLGLTLGRKIIELHGGTISVSSAEGVGTCVSIDLPIPEWDSVDPE